jgi:hypothetical protein
LPLRKSQADNHSQLHSRPRSNFDSFPSSLFTVFQVSSSYRTQKQNSFQISKIYIYSTTLYFKKYYSTVVSNYTLQYKLYYYKIHKAKETSLYYYRVFYFIIISSSSFKNVATQLLLFQLSFVPFYDVNLKQSFYAHPHFSLPLSPHHSFKSANLMRLSMVSLITTFSFRGLFHYRKEKLSLLASSVVILLVANKVDKSSIYIYYHPYLYLSITFFKSIYHEVPNQIKVIYA